MRQINQTQDSRHLPTYTLQTCIDREHMVGKKKLGQGQAGIWIMNKRNGRVAHGHYVGAPSTLGNPFSLGHGRTRLEVIAQYRDWLREQWRLRGPARKALVSLAHEYAREGSLYLVCWCAPKPCHAEVIRDAVLGIVKRGSGK